MSGVLESSLTSFSVVKLHSMVRLWTRLIGIFAIKKFHSEKNVGKVFARMLKTSSVLVWTGISAPGLPSKNFSIILGWLNPLMHTRKKTKQSN